MLNKTDLKRLKRLRYKIFSLPMIYFSFLACFLVIFNVFLLAFNYFSLLTITIEIIILLVYLPLAYLVFKRTRKNTSSYRNECQLNVYPKIIALIDDKIEVSDLPILQDSQLYKSEIFTNYKSHIESPILCGAYNNIPLAISKISIDEKIVFIKKHRIKSKNFVSFSGFILAISLNKLDENTKITLFNNKQFQQNYIWKLKYLKNYQQIEINNLKNYFTILTNDNDAAERFFLDGFDKYLTRIIQKNPAIEHIEIIDGKLFVYINDSLALSFKSLRSIDERFLKQKYQELASIFSLLHDFPTLGNKLTLHNEE